MSFYNQIQNNVNGQSEKKIPQEPMRIQSKNNQIA